MKLIKNIVPILLLLINTHAISKTPTKKLGASWVEKVKLYTQSHVKPALEITVGFLLVFSDLLEDGYIPKDACVTCYPRETDGFHNPFPHYFKKKLKNLRITNPRRFFKSCTWISSLAAGAYLMYLGSTDLHHELTKHKKLAESEPIE